MKKKYLLSLGIGLTAIVAVTCFEKFRADKASSGAEATALQPADSHPTASLTDEDENIPADTVTTARTHYSSAKQTIAASPGLTARFNYFKGLMKGASPQGEQLAKALTLIEAGTISGSDERKFMNLELQRLESTPTESFSIVQEALDNIDPAAYRYEMTYLVQYQQSLGVAFEQKIKALQTNGKLLASLPTLKFNILKTLAKNASKEEQNLLQSYVEDYTANEQIKKTMLKIISDAR